MGTSEGCFNNTARWNSSRFCKIHDLSLLDKRPLNSYSGEIRPLGSEEQGCEFTKLKIGVSGTAAWVDTSVGAQRKKKIQTYCV